MIKFFRCHTGYCPYRDDQNHVIKVAYAKVDSPSVLGRVKIGFQCMYDEECTIVTKGKPCPLFMQSR